IPADEVRKALEAELGALERREARVARRPARAREGAKPRDVKAAWDLDARHHVEWYPIPHETPADRAAAWALAMLLTARLQGEAALSGAGARALATADLLSPAGRFLAVSASLPAGADVAKVRAAIRSAIDRVLEPSSTVPSADAFLRQMAQQAGALPDFQLLRKQLAGQPMADVLEAQAVLTIAHQEISTGLARAELAKALRGLKAQDLEAFAAKNLGAARRSTLLLEPAADE
ncbi:MAG: hypothetical protein HY721_02875, partial [Planctomycetes bacterium]|nr:hypothetical protein [Planctomycetota bacterium]